jgi:ATP-binding cassette subfamily F protein 3
MMGPRRDLSCILRSLADCAIAVSLNYNIEYIGRDDVCFPRGATVGDFVGKSSQLIRSFGLMRDTLMNQLTHYERICANIARGVEAAPSILILDGVTKYLSLGGILRLIRALKKYPNSVIVVAQDRFLLNAVAEYHIELSHTHSLIYYRGNYDRAEEQRARRYEDALHTWGRNPYTMPRPYHEHYMDVRIFPMRPCTDTRLTISLVDYPIAVIGTLTTMISMTILPCSRIGLIGDRKIASMFLRAVVARSGVRRFGYAAPGWPRHIDRGATLTDLCVEGGAPSTEFARETLVAAGVEAQLHSRAVSDVSNKIYARTVLAAALCTRGELIVLEEPTRHLDIPSVNALVHFCNQYRGTIVVFTSSVDLLTRAKFSVYHGHSTPTSGAINPSSIIKAVATPRA